MEDARILFTFDNESCYIAFLKTCKLIDKHTWLHMSAAMQVCDPYIVEAHCYVTHSSTDAYCKHRCS